MEHPNDLLEEQFTDYLLIDRLSGGHFCPNPNDHEQYYVHNGIRSAGRREEKRCRKPGPVSLHCIRQKREHRTLLLTTCRRHRQNPLHKATSFTAVCSVTPFARRSSGIVLCSASTCSTHNRFRSPRTIPVPVHAPDEVFGRTPHRALVTLAYRSDAPSRIYPAASRLSPSSCSITSTASRFAC